MKDCFWHRAKLCSEECQCSKYVSINSEAGEKLNAEYSQDMSKAVVNVKKAVRDKWRLMR